MSGFGIILFLFVITIAVSLNSIWKLMDNVELTQDHPLTVTRAVTEIEVLTTSIHRSMKDVVLSINKNERAYYLSLVEEDEKKV